MIMETPTPTRPQSLSLEDIRQMKAGKLEEVRSSKERMNERARRLFAPPEPQSGTNALMQHFNSGIAIFDGVMTGIRIMRKLQRFFGKRR